MESGMVLTPGNYQWYPPTMYTHGIVTQKVAINKVPYFVKGYIGLRNVDVTTFSLSFQKYLGFMVYLVLSLFIFCFEMYSVHTLFHQHSSIEFFPPL